MRQFFILFGVFISFSVLADHDGTLGHNYNGRSFHCNNFRRAKEFAETYGGGGNYYNFALCQLHRGHLMPGVATLKQAAAMGESYAAIEVGRYYSSEGYTLSLGQVTEKEINLQKAIEYQKQALQVIRQSNYPFSDPHGDYLSIERQDHPYLNTASNLTGNYMNLYSARSVAHIKSINQNIEDATLEPLRNAIGEASRCLSIPYNSNVWSEKVYNNTMNLCREAKEFAEVLLPLERDRLRAARVSCQNTRLSQCAAHNAIDSRIEQLYGGHLDRIAQLLSAI